MSRKEIEYIKKYYWSVPSDGLDKCIHDFSKKYKTFIDVMITHIENMYEFFDDRMSPIIFNKDVKDYDYRKIDPMIIQIFENKKFNLEKFISNHPPHLDVMYRVIIDGQDSDYDIRMDVDSEVTEATKGSGSLWSFTLWERQPIGDSRDIPMYTLKDNGSVEKKYITKLASDPFPSLSDMQKYIGGSVFIEDYTNNFKIFIL